MMQTNDEQIKAIWAEVVNPYQRRVDLLPNLVNTVERYAAHEKTFPTNLTAMAFGFAVKPNFTVANEKAISAAPKVNFDALPAPTR